MWTETAKKNAAKREMMLATLAAVTAKARMVEHVKEYYKNCPEKAPTYIDEAGKAHWVPTPEETKREKEEGWEVWTY